MQGCVVWYPSHGKDDGEEQEQTKYVSEHVGRCEDGVY